MLGSFNNGVAISVSLVIGGQWGELTSEILTYCCDFSTENCQIWKLGLFRFVSLVFFDHAPHTFSD